MKLINRKLQQLPTGWVINGEGFRLECTDGMHCTIERVDNGYLCCRRYAEGNAQSAIFCTTWKEVVAATK